MFLKASATLPGMLLWLLLAVGYALYSPGQQGVFHFDDQVNLRGLSQVTDGWTALVFIGTGEFGTFPRSVALASFLLNWGDWPNHRPGFLYINILIHLLNGALLAWFSLRLLRLTRPEWSSRAEWIALSTAAIWLLMPLLASTGLIIVQRMASLCATFVLMGLLVYLVGLSWEASGRVTQGRWLQVGGIGFGTLLAGLAKENGALLPLYALVLEGTVLAGVATLSAWRRWRMRLLAVPPVLMLAYIVLLWPGMMAAYETRDFTPVERLLTQAVILWDYLRLALLPRAVAFSPFHDDYPVVRDLLAQPWALAALLGWLAALTLAFWQRRRWPVFALAVLWYLGGHVLESTVLPLELYFEHRNYLPLIGPVLALAWLAWTLTGKMRRMGPVLIGAYTLLLTAVLWQTTTLWGQPLFAGKMWASHHPASARAQQFLAQYYAVVGDRVTAYQVLDRTTDLLTDQIDLALQTLRIACNNGDEDEVKKSYERALPRLKTGKYNNTSLSALSDLIDLQKEGRCTSIDRKQLRQLIDDLLSNPRYQSDVSRYYLHFLISRLYQEQRDFDGTVRHLKESFYAMPNIDTALLVIGTLLSGGLHKEADIFLNEVRQQLPRNPILRIAWQKLLYQVAELIKKPALDSKPANSQGL